MRQNQQINLDAVRDVIFQAAVQCQPHELCGFLLQTQWETRFLACTNIAPQPCETFELSADDWLHAHQMGEVLAIVHSHPKGEPFLSGADRQSQILSALPWVLCVSGSLKVFQPVPHLRGREFVYDVADCYRLVQDAYHLAGIDLMDVARSNLDTDAQAGLFDQYVAQAGFRRVAEPQAGDIILSSCRGDGQSDHIALYLGNGQLLHHAYGQLSRCEALGAWWQRHITGFWRHEKWQPEKMAAIGADLRHSA